MKLKVINPDGVHCKEIKGLKELEASLPSHWLGYAAFELVGHDGGEIDLILCTDDRLIIVEIKDWNVPIKDHGATWEMPWGTKKSPVVLTGEKARKLSSKLKKFFEPRYYAPFVDHCVLFTGSSKRSNLNEDTREKVFELEFFKTLGTKGTYQKNFPSRARIDIPRDEIKSLLDNFFSGGRVRSLRKLYNGYRASDDACYEHPQKIYREYFAELDGAKGFRALLRKWDFGELGNVDTAYRSKENFEAIALREENAVGFLNQNKPELADRNAFLQPISNEGRGAITTNFFELYKLPHNLSRLKEALRRYSDLKDDQRVSICRLLLSHFAELHEINVAHRDIGAHCIWVHIPDKVSLSGFATSSFPEQKTVSKIRDTIRAGAERIPEELQNLKSDNFRKDVFLLGSVVHQILFGEKPEALDGVPIWTEPASKNFHQFWPWLDRALEPAPSKRFPDATAAFQEFQRCSRKPDMQELDEREFCEFEKPFPPMPRPPSDKILRQDANGVVFRADTADGISRLIKVWPNAKFKPGSAADNLHLLDFFTRVQRLQLASILSQQQILDFGLTSFGSYVELKWDDGDSMAEFEGLIYNDESGLALVLSLVRAVAHLHRCEIYHGDLKPENILLVENKDEGGSIVRLIDLVDFSPAGTERRSSAYLPPEGEEATTPGCDGYALKKIVTEFLLPRMPEVSAELKERISAILSDMLDPDGGIPDLRGALEELEAPLPSGGVAETEAAEELIISMGGIDSELIMTPDDRGLPITISRDKDDPECFVLRITDSTHSLGLLVNAIQRTILKIWFQPGSIMDFTQNLRWKAASLGQPLRVRRSQSDNLSALENFLHDSGLFSELERRLGQPCEFAPIAGNEEIVDDDLAQGVNTSPEAQIADVPLEELWEALLDAEANIVPVVVVTGEPVEIQNSGVIVLPVGDPSSPFDPQDDESIQVETRDPEGEWRFFGYLDNRKSKDGRLAVVPKAKGAFRPVIGTALRLENRASRASYDKRLAAVQRILSRESVSTKLFDYFIGSDTLSGTPTRFASRLAELEQYGLNPVQKDALETALKCSPLAMIQGPPGTGKTSVISAAVHYIAKNYPTAKILVVSQSHEAIDHATEQIVKRFRNHGDEPSLVRVGRSAAISDNLISFHSESLQGEYRERFRLSLTQRILPLGRRLGLDDAFSEAFTVLRARLVPLLQQLGPKGVEEDADIDPTLRRNLENACRQLDPRFDFQSAPIASVCGLMEQRLIDHHGETDHQAINALRRVIDLALEWVQILEAPGKLDRYYVGACQIVTGTCVGVGRWHLGLEGETFDCVIIDEAARCGPGDLAVACQVAQQVILVGDHRQLPPFLEKDVINRVARELACPASQVGRSDFQRLFEAPFANSAGRTLKTQYRMREPIGRLVSECFYPETGGIEAGRFTSAECYSRLPKSISHHVTWIDSGDGVEERVRTSFVNRFEIDRILEILEEIDRDEELVQELIDDAALEGLPASIGIIAAYKAQADAIEARIWESSLSSGLRQTCKIGTVDSYQGKENPIVIFSAVRCNPHDEIGFTRSWERVNVSLSRARERLVVVGNWNFWENAGHGAPLGKVVGYLAARLAGTDEGYARIMKKPESL